MRCCTLQTRCHIHPSTAVILPQAFIRRGPLTAASAAMQLHDGVWWRRRAGAGAQPGSAAAAVAQQVRHGGSSDGRRQAGAVALAPRRRSGLWSGCSRGSGPAQVTTLRAGAFWHLPADFTASSGFSVLTVGVCPVPYRPRRSPGARRGPGWLRHAKLAAAGAGGGAGTARRLAASAGGSSIPCSRPTAVVPWRCVSRPVAAGVTVPAGMTGPNVLICRATLRQPCP